MGPDGGRWGGSGNWQGQREGALASKPWSVPAEAGWCQHGPSVVRRLGSLGQLEPLPSSSARNALAKQQAGVLHFCFTHFVCKSGNDLRCQSPSNSSTDVPTAGGGLGMEAEADRFLQSCMFSILQFTVFAFYILSCLLYPCFQ